MGKGSDAMLKLTSSRGQGKPKMKPSHKPGDAEKLAKRYKPSIKMSLEKMPKKKAPKKKAPKKLL